MECQIHFMSKANGVLHSNCVLLLCLVAYIHTLLATVNRMEKMLLLTSWLSWDKFNGYCINMIVLLLYFGIYKNIRLTISL